MISKQSIERLKSQIDIVDIVSHYIPLKRSGSNFVAICPFHDDRNPSMSVNSQLGIYHCFSCKAGGDAIKFVMDYENLSYPEAIEKIASILNFSLEYTNQDYEKRQDKQILQKLNAFYQSELYKNNEALRYLYSRGFNDDLIAQFQLGWAGSSSTTIRFLENENISPQEALEVGVIKQNERGYYASFVDRITFVIKSHTAKIVGFGGRTISNHPAKYVNSPQSVVFDKSQIFYAYDIAKKSALEKKELIITEGYMDTIMLHKAGFTNAVAVLGTALTQKHLPLIKRGGFRVILSFDGDSAGINAAIKSARLLSENEIDSSVVIIKDGLDPADMVMQNKIKELKYLYSSGVESGEFLITEIIKNFDISRPIQKQKALEEVQKYTFCLKPVIANSYKNFVSSLLKIDDNFSLSNDKFISKDSQNKGIQRQIPKQNSFLQKDFLELSVLKTMHQKEDFKNYFLDNFTTKVFRIHQNVFEILQKEEKNEQDLILLREIFLDEKIKILTKEEFLQGLDILKEKYLLKLLDEIKKSNDENKIQKIKKINEMIKNLRLKK